MKRLRKEQTMRQLFETHLISMLIYGCWTENRGFYPQIIHFSRVFHYKPFILVYPYFWKHPYWNILYLTFSFFERSSYSFVQKQYFPATRTDAGSRIRHLPAVHQEGCQRIPSHTPLKINGWNLQPSPICKRKWSEPNLHDYVPC